MRRNIKTGVATTSIISNLNAQMWYNIYYGNSYFQKRTTVDLRHLDKETFYPVLLNQTGLAVIKYNIQTEAIDTTSGCERLMFDLGGSSWGGYPRYFRLYQFSIYNDATPKTIGSIGYGRNREGWHAVWLIGGYRYNVFSSSTNIPKVYENGFETGIGNGDYERYTSGPTITGGDYEDANHGVAIVWRRTDNYCSSQMVIANDLRGYLSLSGGTLTGDLTINGNVTVNGKIISSETE